MNKALLSLCSVVTIGLAVLHAQTAAESSVIKLEPALDAVISATARLEKLHDGLGFSEGPLWVREGGGYLLFSDIPANVINRWTPDGKLSVYLERTGYTGTESPDAAGVGAQSNNGRQDVVLIGSNGITLDPQGRVVFCAHGDRAIVRVENDGKRTVLADRLEGKRLNSPNDLVYKRNGALYFSDHVAGLRGRDKDPKKELPFQGVFLLKGGKLQVVAKDMLLPNGVALSPDEKVLYVSGRDPRNESVVMRYDVNADDTLGPGRVFVDMSSDKTPGSADGMKVDQKGNVYVTGPGGIWINSPDGKHIGTIRTPEAAANLAFGDADAKAIYITARTGLYRIRSMIPGIRPKT
ncbi:MAG: hypothetical protein A3G20_09685 [Acidobacteria bacterium RIFCSPLOWO2_12_FULL_59_11]|nr:MAG: hypothetical protein A3G20_09685 [Acidobacteria bacterium RIFCSPLOWO2_12_FULL_59_11]